MQLTLKEEKEREIECNIETNDKINVTKSFEKSFNFFNNTI